MTLSSLQMEKGRVEGKKVQEAKTVRRGGVMTQRLGDKSCSDQVSLVPSHLSLFLGVINQSQTGGIDRPLVAPLYVYTPRLYLPLSPSLPLNLIGRKCDTPPSDAISETVHRLTSR